MWSPKVWLWNGADYLLRKGNLVAQKIINGSNGSTPVADANDPNDFQDIGTGLDQVDNYFEAAMNYGVDQSSPGDQYNENNIVGPFPVDSGIDNVTSTYVGAASTSTAYIDIDLGVGNDQPINALSVDWYNLDDQEDRVSDLFKLYWSDDSTSFTLSDTLSFNFTPADAHHTIRKVVGTNALSKRYWRIEWTSEGLDISAVYEFELLVAALATTDISAKAKMLIDAPQQFDTSTAIIKDENGSEVGGSTVKCIEWVNGSAANGGVLVDYSVFKTRGLLSSSSNVQVEVQPVGTQKIQSVQMSTIAQNFTADANGYILKASGAIVSQLFSSGKIRTSSQIVSIPNTLTYGVNIPVNCDLSSNHEVTLTGATAQLDNPTNLENGGIYTFKITQDGSGSRLLTYGTVYKFVGGTAPTLTTASGSVDILRGGFGWY